SFNVLLNHIRNDQIFKNNVQNPQVPPAIQLAITLYFLGLYGGSTVRCAAQWGIGEVTTRLYCNRTISTLVRLQPQLVKWAIPERLEFGRMRMGVEAGSRFPGCVGFVDGMDMILCYESSYYGEIYFNRKKQYALNLDGICNSKHKFRFVTTGFPASVADATGFCGMSFLKEPNLFYSSPDV
ncbi:hypothetical protein HOY80DRAFT_879854, partial [Tuber brumale]